MQSTVAALALSALLPSFSLAAELEEHLHFLQPLMSTDWVGGYVGPDAPDIEILLLFEQLLDGKAVRYTRTAEAANFEAVTHFFWNQERSEVLFLNLNNRGIVGEGVAKFEDGAVVLHGKSYWPDRTEEFKTTLSIGATGTLKDTFIRKEDGEWVPGHVQEFAARK